MHGPGIVAHINMRARVPTTVFLTVTISLLYNDIVGHRDILDLHTIAITQIDALTTVVVECIVIDLNPFTTPDDNAIVIIRCQNVALDGDVADAGGTAKGYHDSGPHS